MISTIQILIFSFLPFLQQSATIEDTSIVLKIVKVHTSTIRVNKTNKAYIIEAADLTGESLYTIISLKNSSFKSPVKIKVGNSYNFNLRKYYKIDSVISLGLKLSVVIDGVYLEIPMSQYTSNIYTTNNLIGKYYICREQ